MNKTKYYELDILQIIKALWHRMWAVFLSAFLFGGAGFSCAAYVMTPIYEAEALLYVNNSSFSLGSTSFSISSSELTAAQSLVDTYIVILKTRTTLNAVIEDAELDYSVEELKEMITSDAVNSTEVFSIRVASDDPQEAERIANSIARILPDKISDVVEGSSVRIVDYAVMPSEKVSPSITGYAAIGFVLGAVGMAVIIAIIALLDTKIHDENYLIQTYDLPVLAVIPDLYHINTTSKYYSTQSTADDGKELKK